MKLKCVDHDRRVLMLNLRKAIHRNDGSECKSELTIGNVHGHIADIVKTCPHMSQEIK